MRKLLLLVTTIIVVFSISATAKQSDQYISGYATSILQQKYSLNMTAEMREGQLFLPMVIAGNPNYNEIIKELSTIDGVDVIKLVDDEEMKRLSRVWLFPLDPLFRPLIADPRWPRFGVAWHRYTRHTVTRNEFEASFGRTFSLLRGGLGESALIDLGVQAGMNAVFDFDTPSDDIYNIDYFLGIPITYQWKGFSLMGRFYHVSTHLGDEYMLSHPQVERVNLSYEALNVIGSFEPTQWFRVYGGGEYYVDPDPASFGNWGYMGGIELYVDPEYSGLPRTIVAVHVKGVEATDYNPSYSAKLGIQIWERTLLSLDYYKGYSPNGQFFNDKVSYWGFSFAFFDL